MAITHEELTFALRDFALSLASAMGRRGGLYLERMPR